ncbi:MAG: tetratricopeptide repeat protein [Alcanivorax sp.]|nr:tetratricopeptide repeat protein [Alcanivorax sp.]
MRRSIAALKPVFAVMLLAAGMMMAGCATTAGQSASSGQNAVPMSDKELALFNQAMAKIAAQKYQAGIDLLDQLVSSNRKSAVPFINMALANEKLDKLEAAEKNLKTALDVEPDNPVANNEYGLLLRKQGKFDQARSVYEKILKKYPNFALANKNLGILCDIYLRDYQCALKAYQAYSAAVPDDEKAKMWVTDMQYRTKK